MSDGWNPHPRGVPTKVRGAVPPPLFVFCRVMDSRSAATWEQERRAPVRARGAQDGGGPPGPSTMKGERQSVKKLNK